LEKFYLKNKVIIGRNEIEFDEKFIGRKSQKQVMGDGDGKNK